MIEEKEMPLVSVVVPCYNHEKYVKETIESIINQTYKNIELIVIDDGSKDNSLEICNEYQGENVKVYYHPNMGVSKTRNRGIELAQGDAIIFVDQDDAMRSGFYTEEMRYQIEEQLNKGIDLIITGVWYGDAELRRGFFRSIEKLKKGVYEGRNNAISWGNTFTFNMNLFSRRLFFDEQGNATPVRFFDLSLDVETIFRHITQYYARKILFSDQYSFCVRRNNENSVSSNWDWLKVYPVKCDAYYNLIRWHKTYFPNDTESISGAMKSFLNVISDMIIANQRNGSDLEMLCENVSKSIYYDDLLKMIKSYPNESVLISDFVASPLSLNKRLHMSLFRRLVKLRWKLYAKLNPQKSFDLRGNILKISN